MKRVLLLASSIAGLFGGGADAPVQVAYIAGGATSQTGTDVTLTATGPTVPAGGVQIFDLVINSDSVTASLDGGGWSELAQTDSSGEPNRIHRYVRAGPVTTGTVTVTLSSGVAALGFCYGMTGPALNSVDSISAYINNPSAPAVTSVALAMQSVAIASSTYPRYANTAPAGSTIASNVWKYTGTGGIGLCVVYEATGVGSISIGDWLMWDPDADIAEAELYRQIATVFEPA